MIEKIHFSTLDEAIEYAKDNGGWIFSDDNRTIGIWYNPAVYGMSQILRDVPGTGRVDTRKWFISERGNRMKMNKLTESQIENLAKEIRQFLLDNGLWVDVTIYFNGKAFSTCDENGNFFYNDPDHLVVIEKQNPRDYFQYVAEPHILSMSFEGDFCGCLNYYNEYGAAFDDRIQTEFSAILAKYGLYYELGNHWNLTCYYM